MSKRRNWQGNRCERCRIGHEWCFCDKLQKVPNATPIISIMHHREKWLPSNTVNLAQLTLSRHQGLLYGMKNMPITEQQLNFEGRLPLFLYPDDEARPIAEFSAEKVCLIVPDGSWRQASKMKKRLSFLKNVPSVKIEHSHPSRYHLRRQTKKEGLCTYEAMAYALGELEGRQAQELMLNNLDYLVYRTLLARNFICAMPGEKL